MVAVACSHPESRTPTGAVCRSDSMLTYDNFGQPFMERYCTRCHASYLHGADRQGAPLYHDFDTLFGIVAVADHVDEWAAAGPNASNEFMPPDGDKPTLEEREQLGTWLACEVANIGDQPDAGPGAALDSKH